MQLSARDRTILKLIDYFNQASSRHVQDILFSDNASKTPARRALTRLVDNGYLERLSHPLAGGMNGGRGTPVYTLGVNGWRLCGREGRYRPKRAIDLHTLTVVDVYANITRLQREGVLVLNGFTPEPDAWRNIDGNDLRPDLHVDISRPNSQRRLIAWLEVDMGTQRPARLQEKMTRYVRAFNSGELDEFPLVVFVCHDEARRKEIAYAITQRPAEEQRLFRAVTVDNFPLNMG